MEFLQAYRFVNYSLPIFLNRENQLIKVIENDLEKEYDKGTIQR